jgi:predicted dehydrogenase
MEVPELRVGIIGVGWGTLVHGPAFSAVDGYRVQALCSRRIASVTAAAEKLQIGEVSTDWHEFVRRDDLDLISISSPVEMHRSMFLEALEAGKHVLCEKPLARDASEGAEMAAAAEVSDRSTLVCFENRWSPERLAMRQLVAQGVIGTPSFIQVAITSGSWHPSHRSMSPWMYRREAGGGYLNGQLSHEIDFVQTLFGAVVTVAADVRHSIDTVMTPDGEIPVDADDTVGLLLRLESGALAVLTNSSAGLNADTNLWEAHGRNGSIVVNRSRVGQGSFGVYSRIGTAEPMPLVATDRELASRQELPARRSSNAVRAMALMLEDWLPSFEGGTTQTPTIRDGARVQQVIDAAHLSSDGAGWVNVTP